MLDLRLLFAATRAAKRVEPGDRHTLAQLETLDAGIPRGQLLPNVFDAPIPPRRELKSGL